MAYKITSITVSGESIRTKYEDNEKDEALNAYNATIAGPISRRRWLYAVLLEGSDADGWQVLRQQLKFSPT